MATAIGCLKNHWSLCQEPRCGPATPACACACSGRAVRASGRSPRPPPARLWRCARRSAAGALCYGLACCYSETLSLRYRRPGARPGRSAAQRRSARHTRGLLLGPPCGVRRRWAPTSPSVPGSLPCPQQVPSIGAAHGNHLGHITNALMPQSHRRS